MGFAPIHSAVLQSAPFSSVAEEVASASGCAGLQPPPCLPPSLQILEPWGLQDLLWLVEANCGETSGPAAVLIHWWL